jgi:hypothetical protein
MKLASSMHRSITALPTSLVPDSNGALDLLRQRRQHPAVDRIGGAEQRHNPIAHHLIDGPLIAVDRRHHAFQHRAEELAVLLGVAIGQHFHGAFQIG